jgi:DNA-directed RNA polymerase specialized sigma24 family protein
MMEEMSARPHVAMDECDERFEQLFRDENRPMIRLAYTLIGNAAEAEEVVQDSFVDVYRRFDEIRKPGAYLRTAVVNNCRSLLRRRRVFALDLPEPPAGLDPDACDLWDVLGHLTEDERIAVTLRYFGRYRAAEIARLVDAPPSTVRSRIRSGLHKLREELES